MRAAEGGGSEGSEDEEERRGVTGGRDRLAERLQQDAAEAAGRLHRNLAHRVTVPDQSEPAEASSSEDGSDEEDDDDAAAAAAAAARAAAYGAGRFRRGHELSATALALSLDGATAFTVSKDGSILKWDVETGRKLQLMRCARALAAACRCPPAARAPPPAAARSRLVRVRCARAGRPTPLRAPPAPAGPAMAPHPRRSPEAADWVKRGGVGNGGLTALYAAALSSDGRFFAAGGGDRKARVHTRGRRGRARPRVLLPGLRGTALIPPSPPAPRALRQVHVFDAVSGGHVASYPGHRDVVSGLAFREGTHTLYSASFDRTVKVWSLDDGAYGAARARRALGAPGAAAAGRRRQGARAAAGNLLGAHAPALRRAAPQTRALARARACAQWTRCLATRRRSTASTRCARSAS